MRVPSVPKKHPHDGRKVKVVDTGCCSEMLGILSITETLAFVDFNDNKCPEGHIGVFLSYPFEKHYKPR